MAGSGPAMTEGMACSQSRPRRRVGRPASIVLLHLLLVAGMDDAVAGGGEDVALAGMVGGADEAFLLHPLDQRGGAVVADLQAALDVGGGAFLVAHDDLDGLVVEVGATLLAEGALVEHRAA